MIDAFCHILPPKSEETRWARAGSKDFAASSPGHLQYVRTGKKAPNYEGLTDRDARFRMMDEFEGYRQVISLAGPPPEHIAPDASVELATIATAREKDCPYIWAAHAPAARREGIADATIFAIRDRSSLDGLAAEERDIVEYARQILTNHRVAQDQFNRLTGLRQKVANFPGVTVEHRMGKVKVEGVGTLSNPCIAG